MLLHGFVSDGLGWQPARGGVGWDKAAARAGLKCFTTLHPLSFPSTPAVELLYFHGRALTVDQMVQRTDLDSQARVTGE